MTCKKLGFGHAELTLPLVTQLLEIHPFFDTPEPDIEDPAYLCILVLVFNAAHCLPTVGPLLDEVIIVNKAYQPRASADIVNRFARSAPANNSNVEIDVFFEI